MPLSPRVAQLIYVTALTVAAATESRADSTINLAASGSPSAGQPGVTVLSLTGSNFPSGTILPAALKLTLQTAPGANGPAMSASVSAFAPIPGNGGRIT